MKYPPVKNGNNERNKVTKKITIKQHPTVLTPPLTPARRAYRHEPLLVIIPIVDSAFVVVYA